MPNITRSARANVDASTAQFAPQITGLLCGEDIAAGQACEIRNDGKIYKLAAGTFAGIAPKGAKATQPLTIFGTGCRFHAADGTLTVGALYYLSATAGEISDAATARDAQGAFLAVSKSDLVVLRTGKVT